MNSLKQWMTEAAATVDVFEDEAIATIKGLLPTGNVCNTRYNPTGPVIYAFWERGAKHPLWVGQTCDFVQRTDRHIEDRRFDPRRHILTAVRKQGATEDHLRDLEAAAILALKPTLTKHQPYRRGTGPKLRGYIESLS